MTPRPEPPDAARDLLAERFPGAVGAWLGGSAARGRTTATSDLDVVVLLADGDPHRLSVEHAGWPVELFVHVAASVRHYVAEDLARRRPTMARLVGEGVPLLRGPEADALAADCRTVLAAGPAPLTTAEVEARRYQLSDLYDDLLGGGPPGEVAGIAVEAWRVAGELVLDLGGRWRGTGKWQARELAALDAAGGTAYGPRLRDGLEAALGGDPAPLVEVVGAVLDLAGGRLWVGYTVPGVNPDRPAGR